MDKSVPSDVDIKIISETPSNVLSDISVNLDLFLPKQEVIKDKKLEKLLKKDEDEYNLYCKYNYIPAILPPVKRIIAIGDLHGDYGLTIDTLKIAKLIKMQNDKPVWIGGETVVVQVGDQVDRCRPYDTKCDRPDATVNDEHSDLKILELFTELNKQANKVGGLVISLLGNHELMNVMGNLNYVSYKGLTEFAEYVDANNPDKDFGLREGLSKLETGINARKHAFAPGNEWGKYLACTRLSFVIIGSFIFVHAGIVPKLTKSLHINHRRDFIKINQLVRSWLLGLIENDENLDIIIKNSKISLFWDRILGSIPPNVNINYRECKSHLKPVLKLLELKGMVVGHTPQFFKNKDKANATCSNSLFRIDNGGSQAFSKFDNQLNNNGEISVLRGAQALEILNDGKTINLIKVNGKNKIV